MSIARLSWSQRAVEGGKRGLRAGIIVAVVTLLLNLLLQGKAYASYQLTPYTASLIYVAAGSIGGVIAGLMSPLIRGLPSAALVGGASFIPLVLFVRLARFGFNDWGANEEIGIVAIAVIMGGAWGAFLWRRNQKDEVK